MKDPWYSQMVSEKGNKISGTAAFLQRVRLEGGMMEILHKVTQFAVQNTMQGIAKNFSLLPKGRGKD